MMRRGTGPRGIGIVPFRFCTARNSRSLGGMMHKLGSLLDSDSRQRTADSRPFAGISCYLLSMVCCLLLVTACSTTAPATTSDAKPAPPTVVDTARFVQSAEAELAQLNVEQQRN